MPISFIKKSLTMKKALQDANELHDKVLLLEKRLLEKEFFKQDSVIAHATDEKTKLNQNKIL